MTWTRPLLALAVAALLLVVPTGAAHADCAAPTITLSQREAAPGETVTVGGTHFGTQCNDVNPSPGRDVLGPPAADLDIVVRNGGAERELMHVDADDDYTFSARVTLPRDLVQGEADFFARDASGQQVGDSLDLWIRGEPVDARRDLRVPIGLGGAAAAVVGVLALALLTLLRRRATRH